jgi:peptidoglycan/xylan/chitin deacetylase (PgdA/CDA1 family)
MSTWTGRRSEHSTLLGTTSRGEDSAPSIPRWAGDVSADMPGALPPKSPWDWRRRAKALAGRILFASGLHRRLFRERAVIAVFHRIDDRYPTDPITCSRAEFVRYCEFFRKHFRVVSLTHLVQELARGGDISRMLVITFDDGYADNYDFAAAELERRGLPATFFLTTSFIGTPHCAWWDRQRGIDSEWMTWDQARDLRRRGFEVAPHTMTHPDLGEVPYEMARQEIEGSKERLLAEVRDPALHFSYPFGQKEHLVEHNRRAVVEAGLASCLSSFGGVVKVSDDAHALHRTPVNRWLRSPYQYGLEVALYYSRRCPEGATLG